MRLRDVSRQRSASHDVSSSSCRLTAGVRRFKAIHDLGSAGEGAPQPDTKSVVRQGFIEKSNVNAVAEMSRMIEVTRAYTQISTLLQQQHDLHKTAIQQLADVPA